jgi:hypothetical protein
MKLPIEVKNLHPLEFIKWLNARKFWTGKAYRSACGQYISNFLEERRESVVLNIAIENKFRRFTCSNCKKDFFDKKNGSMTLCHKCSVTEKHNQTNGQAEKNNTCRN